MADVYIKERKPDVNHFTFTGYIVGRRENKRKLTISFRSNTKDKSGRTRSNSMTILAFDDDVKEQLSSISLRKKVTIEGVIRTRTERDDYGRALPPVNRAMYERKLEREQEMEEKDGEGNFKDDKKRPYLPSQYFVAMKVSQVPESTEDANEIDITGSVDSASVTPGGMIRFTIRTNANGMANVNLYMSPKTCDDCISVMRARARVKIKAHCKTKASSTDTGIEYTEDYIVDEIKLI